jgi:Domain of unknown function (DUF4276)
VKVLLVVEGDGEYQALPRLLPALTRRSGHTLLRPRRIKVHPLAPAGVIAKACRPVLKQAAENKVDLVVLILDREDSGSCCGARAREIVGAVAAACNGALAVDVVLKNRCFENWLVADIEALRAQPGRYVVSEAMRRKVEPDKADGIDALDLLRAAISGKIFHKVDDAVAICSRLDPARAARHSRSFRHLLHVLGDPDYAHQCRRPGAE